MLNCQNQSSQSSMNSTDSSINNTSPTHLQIQPSPVLSKIYMVIYRHQFSVPRKIPVEPIAFNPPSGTILYQQIPSDHPSAIGTRSIRLDLLITNLMPWSLIFIVKIYKKNFLKFRLGQWEKIFIWGYSRAWGLGEYRTGCEQFHQR